MALAAAFTLFDLSVHNQQAAEAVISPLCSVESWMGWMERRKRQLNVLN